MKLFNSRKNAQADAVLAYVSDQDGLECSWNEAEGRYNAEPDVYSWYNGREHGYVIVLRSHNYGKQLNIAFFENRSSDDITAIAWEETTYNPPTFDSEAFDAAYHNKNAKKTVRYGQPMQLADWIHKQMVKFWLANIGE